MSKASRIAGEKVKRKGTQRMNKRILLIFVLILRDMSPDLWSVRTIVVNIEPQESAASDYAPTIQGLAEKLEEEFGAE